MQTLRRLDEEEAVEQIHRRCVEAPIPAVEAAQTHCYPEVAEAGIDCCWEEVVVGEEESSSFSNCESCEANTKDNR